MLIPPSQPDEEQKQRAASQDCHNIDDRLKFIEQSVASLGAKVDHLLCNNLVAKPGLEIGMQSQLQDVATRIERIESLLLRTPLPDFQVLDDAIATLLPQSHGAVKLSTHEGANIVSPPEKEACRREVNVSINPEFIDQLCIDEADAETNNAASNVVDSLDEASGLLSKSSLQDRVFAAPCCNALRSSDGYAMRPESVQWYPCPCCDVLSCCLSCRSSHFRKCSDRFQDQQLGEDVQSPSEVGVLDDFEDSNDGEEVSNSEVMIDRQLVDRNYDEGEDVSEASCCQLKSASGSSGAGRESWEPWWQRARVPGKGVLCNDAGMPALKPPSHICCPSGQKPHASVVFALLSALYAYAHAMRALNGSWKWAPLDAAPHILYLCPAICDHKIYRSAEECLFASLAAAGDLADSAIVAERNLLCLTDVRDLIGERPDYCTWVLQDMAEMFKACLAAGGDGCTAELRRGMKKLKFLASFAFHHFEHLQPLGVVAHNIQTLKLLGA